MWVKISSFLLISYTKKATNVKKIVNTNRNCANMTDFLFSLPKFKILRISDVLH